MTLNDWSVVVWYHEKIRSGVMFSSFSPAYYSAVGLRAKTAISNLYNTPEARHQAILEGAYAAYRDNNPGD